MTIGLAAIVPLVLLQSCAPSHVDPSARPMAPAAATTPRAPGSQTVEPELDRVGYGATSSGGAGGEVCVVDSSSASQLRDCLSRPGPVIVDFDGSLTIQLDRPLSIDRSYITLDGRGASVTILQPPGRQDGVVFKRGAHDIVILNIRFSGDWSPGQPTCNDCAVLAFDGDPRDNQPITDVYLDGITVGGAADAGPDFWCGAKDFTMARSVIHHSFHPVGLGCSTPLQEGDPRARERITFYQNVFVYNGERQPQLREGVYDLDFINNIVAFWQDYTTSIGRGVGGYGMRIDDDGHVDRVNVVGNAFVPGPWRPNWGCVWGDEARWDDEDQLRADALHYADNILPPEHNAEECVSTATGSRPLPRPYSLWMLPASRVAEILDVVGARPLTTTEETVLDELRSALAGGPVAAH